MNGINVDIKPYPDECSYSFICRCAVRIPQTSNNRICKTLFEQYQDLSKYVFRAFRGADIQNWLGYIWSKEYFLRNHSCIPYYSLILKDEYFSLLIENINNDSDDIRIYERKITQACGYNKSRYHNLRYCPACAEEDLKLYGEVYWHRLPQILGVIICPKHDTAILDSEVDFSFIRHRFIPASYIFYNARLIPSHKVELSRRFIGRYKRLAKDTEWLLQNGLELRSVSDKDHVYEKNSDFESYLEFDQTFLRHLLRYVSKLNIDEKIFYKRGHLNANHPLLRLLYIEIIHGNIKNYMQTLL